MLQTKLMRSLRISYQLWATFELCFFICPFFSAVVFVVSDLEQSLEKKRKKTAAAAAATTIAGR